MYKFYLLIPIVLLPLCSKGQTTIRPSMESTNNYIDIDKVELTETETIVYLRIRSQKYKTVSFSSATVMVPYDDINISDLRNWCLEIPFLPVSPSNQSLRIENIKRIKKDRAWMNELGYMIRGLGNDRLDMSYKTNSKKEDYYYFELHFGKLPVGVEKINIREQLFNGRGKEWIGVKIKNPYPTVERTLYDSEDRVRQYASKNNDGIVGIYEQTNNNAAGYIIGCVKIEDEYRLIYLGAKNKDYIQYTSHWQKGEIKAKLRKSSTTGIFGADWYMSDKTVNSNTYVTFDGTTMQVKINKKGESETDTYIKMYPQNPSQIVEKGSEWTGSAFALNDGYVVTNYHVIENANNIYLKGIDTNFNNKYKAYVVATDINNDLALLKLESFIPNNIPYSVKTFSSDVGEDIWVLGYPLTKTMGNEIKLTTGVISAKSGFEDDVTMYQISAPIQPGNSGGPVFDSKGNLIGIICAQHKGAENVSYAIKCSYLRNLIENSVNHDILPHTNKISMLNLSSQVKNVKGYVYQIICSQ